MSFSFKVTISLGLCLLVMYFSPSLLLASSDDTQQNSGSACEDKWNSLFSGSSRRGVSELIKIWLNEKNLCLNSGFYEFKLGWLYIYSEEYTKALNTFKRGIEKNKGYVKDLKLGIADVSFNRASRAGQKSEYAIAESLYREMIQEYPTWHAPYEQMAALKLLQDEFESSVEYGENSVRIQPTAYAYRNLAISYQNIGQYEKCIEAMNDGYELDKTLFEDKNLMLSTSVSYTKLKKFELARNTLAVLMQNREGIENDPDFNMVLNYLKNQLQINGIESLPN